MKATALFVGGVAAALTIGMGGMAQAAHDTNPSKKVASYSYSLTDVQPASVPNSRASGSVRIKTLPNGKVQVKVDAYGLMPGVPHAMHLHGVDGPATDQGCPGPSADANGDGHVTTVEGLPFYGGILTSLTTTGDVSPASALALGRFAVADASGHLSYSRTFSQASALANADTVQVVIHGIDLNGNGVYDFEAGPSSLTDAAPLEATIPVLCGGIAN